MNNVIKKCRDLCLLFVFITMIFSVPVISEDIEDSYEMKLFSEVDEALELEEFEGEDIVSEIINFVIERDPVLKAQKEVMEVIDEQKIDEKNDETDEDLPEYIRSTLREEKLEAVMKKQEVQEKYSQIKRELVTELFAKITEIFAQKNKIENQKKLHNLLLTREESIKRQVEAGIMEPQALQDLSEDIIQTQTVIADAEIKMRMLKMEIAFNYGEQDWRELIVLLEELEKSMYE